MSSNTYTLGLTWVKPENGKIRREVISETATLEQVKAFFALYHLPLSWLDEYNLLVVGKHRENIPVTLRDEIPFGRTTYLSTCINLPPDPDKFPFFNPRLN